jgi:hypothetical protein
MGPTENVYFTGILAGQTRGKISSISPKRIVGKPGKVSQMG